MRVHQAYRFALDPTPTQRRALASHAGAARFAFNWGLALVKERLDARAAGAQVQVPWSLAALRREWNQAKGVVAPWWPANSKEAYSSGLDALARGLRGFADAKAGRRVGFPRLKGKRGTRQACRFTTGTIRVEADRHHVTLPRLGTIRTHESTRKLARRVEGGTARILAATVSAQAGRWFVAFTVVVDRAELRPQQPAAIVGVDVGVRHLAVLSTGEQVANPAPLTAARRRLARLGRQLARRQGPRAPDGRRCRPSAGWRAAQQRLARTHARIANLRGHHLHLLTSRLASTYGTVVVEHLNVAGMGRNRHLARAIADTGMAQIRRQLAYKTAWAGGRLVQADTFYPSSKTCSVCQTVKTKLSLSERTYRCEFCGLVADRDLNAARNLAAFAQHLVAGSGSETRNARGPDARPGPARQTGTKREAGTGRHPGKTGTVGPQGSAA
jgi:putative transposase